MEMAIYRARSSPPPTHAFSFNNQFIQIMNIMIFRIIEYTAVMFSNSYVLLKDCFVANQISVFRTRISFFTGQLFYSVDIISLNILL